MFYTYTDPSHYLELYFARKTTKLADLYAKKYC